MDQQVRLATPADASAIRSIYRPYVESTPITFETEPPTVAAVETRMEDALDQYPWLVCEADGAVVGYAAADGLRSAGAFAWTVELSVYVDQDARGSGIGSTLYERLLSVLDAQGYRSAYAAVTDPNPPSERLHERLGFERVGTFPAAGYKDGAWYDVQWWHRQLGPLPDAPDRPQSLSALPEAALNAALDGEP